MECRNTSGSCIGDGSAVVPASVTVGGEVRGGPDAPWGGTASNYSVTIYGSVGINVHGGDAPGGTASNNTVTISGGSVDGGVYGGSAPYSTATGNSVTISDGKVSGEVAGAAQAAAAAKPSITPCISPARPTFPAPRSTVALSLWAAAAI